MSIKTFFKGTEKKRRVAIYVRILKLGFRKGNVLLQMHIVRRTCFFLFQRSFTLLQHRLLDIQILRLEETRF